MKINKRVKNLSLFLVLVWSITPLYGMEILSKVCAYLMHTADKSKVTPSAISKEWLDEKKDSVAHKDNSCSYLQSAKAVYNDIPDFTKWKKRCDMSIPHFIDVHVPGSKNLCDFSTTATYYDEFMKAVHAFIALHKNGELCNPDVWINNDAFDAGFFESNCSFEPFIQALKVNPGTDIIMFGDRHGDVRSTLEMISELADNTHNYFEPNSFKLKPNVLLVGLGDYVDRGNAGVETLLTVMWLKLQNPEQVILVRGNHEDCAYKINKTNFQIELKKKLGASLTQNDIEQINHLYDCMPVAIFIGSGNAQSTHFMIGCHGFIEVGYCPKNLLDMVMKKPVNVSCFEKMGRLQRVSHIKQLSEVSQKAFEDACKGYPSFNRELDPKGTDLIDPIYPHRLGWMWSYAIVDDGTKPFAYDSVSHTWQWGKSLTEDVLSYWSKPSEYTISWIFRGHQHSHNEEYRYYPAIMNNLWKNNGLYKLWSMSGNAHSLETCGAFTLNVAPDNIYAGTDQKLYPGFNYDTWIVVKAGATLADWHIKVINKPMFALPTCSVKVDGTCITPQMPFKSSAIMKKNNDNFYAVEPGKLYRTKLLPAPVLEKYLIDHGIKTIINLREPDPKASWYQEEVALCKKLGVALHTISFHPTILPTKDQLNHLLNIFNDSAQYPILVHCFAGADRTGLISALYVAEQMNGTLDEALKQQHIFYGHNAKAFPHLRKFTCWWYSMKQKFEDYKAILEGYSLQGFMADITAPTLEPAALEGRV